MYPVTAEVAALFDRNQRQVARITGTDANGVALRITEANIMQGGFIIDRYSSNNTRIELGTAISSELTLKLDNSEGAFDGIIFEDAEMFVEIGIADWESASPTVTWIPCGYFTPDEQPRNRTIITLSALDRMMRFETVAPALSPWTTETGAYMKNEAGETLYFIADLVFPCTLAQLVAQVCARCDVELADDLSDLPNADYVIDEVPKLQQDVTFRNIIQWAAALMGGNAFIDWSGKLRISWYTNTGYHSTLDRRYKSDLYENDITITGIKYTDTGNNTYLAGSETYALDITGNYLVTGNIPTVITNIYNSLQGFTYRPFEAIVKPAPWLFPMDRVTFEDMKGDSHVSILTNVNTTINGNTVIAGRGETSKANSYAAPSALTSQQKYIIESLKKVTSDALEKAVDNATKQITGAEDSHVRFIYDGDGGLQEIVIMNTDDIDTATKVWRWNSGGLGYSANGYAGPYTTAITQDGSIVANFITTGELNANIIKAGILTDAAGKNFWNMITGEFSLSANSEIGGRTVSDVLDDVDATITGVNVEYAKNQSTTQAPTSGWSTQAPAWEAGYYIWQRTATTTPEGTTYSDPTCISGRDGGQGEPGDDGVGVSAIVEQYYLSTSDASPVGGTWSTDQPDWASGKYIWTRSHITWTNGTTTDTSPVLAKAINGANQSASDAEDAVEALDTSLNQQNIFNRLTNNGQTQGIYLENGLLYINGTYIQSGTIAAGRIDAANLHVSAANIDGTLTIGQLPATVAEESDIPTKVSELTNDSGFQNATQVTTIAGNVITTAQLNADNITTGTMSADRISGGSIDASDVTIENLDASNITTGTLDADLIRAGTITDAQNKSTWDLDNGTMSLEGSFATSATDGLGNTYRMEFANGLLRMYYNGNRVGSMVWQGINLLFGAEGSNVAITSRASQPGGTGITINDSGGILFLCDTIAIQDPWATSTLKYGATGTFATADNKQITVQNGLIVGIDPIT